MRSMASNWFFQCAAGALAVVLASGLATAWFGTGLQLPSTTTRDGAVTAMNRYVSGPIPDVVLVGSSLTYRLSESYFSKSKVRNLALAGGSPVTGLEIVNARAELPKIVLI
jgi:hypothetical protein